MGKNANKKAKFKPIVFEIQKDRFKKAIKNQLKHIASYSWENNSVLQGVLFKIDNNILTMVSTDGSALLKQEMPVNEVIHGGSYEIVLSALHLAKAGIKNHHEGGRKQAIRCLDNLVFTINEDHAVIEDKFNGIKYVIPQKYGNFPEYEKFLTPKSKEKSVSFAFNMYLMARFEEIGNSRSGVSVITVSKENPEESILITANNNEDDIKVTGVLMPVRLRE